MSFLNLFKHKVIFGDEIDLIERFKIDEDCSCDGVGVIAYNIVLHDSLKRVGEIDLRLTMNDYMYYYGHIGYHIYEKHRGHHYASKACRLIIQKAKELEMEELIITCNPDNYASIKTIEALNAKFIERVDVPKDHELYKDDKEKLIYKVELNDARF